MCWRPVGANHEIIDWEMFGLKPRYFDLIHYFVSADLLLRRADAPDILRNLDQLGAGSGSSWKRCVGLYFACQAYYYYGVRYAHQTDLHPQTLWQMKVWRKVLQILISTAVD